MLKRIPLIYMDFRVHAHGTEDESKVESAVRNAFGKVEIRRKATSGFHGNPIIVLSGRIGNRKTIRQFLARLPIDYLNKLAEEAEKRIGEDLMIHLRIDKQATFEGNIKLPSDIGDTISVSIKIEAFPANLQNALRSLNELLHEICKNDLDEDRHS